MKIVDPGHRYDLTNLDIPPHMEDRFAFTHLTFVKREGEGYPGNVGSYPGTNMQEVLRALIDRVKYLDNQIPNHHNSHALTHLRWALWHFEKRAAERHKRPFFFGIEDIENKPVCEKCGHIGCTGRCH